MKKPLVFVAAAFACALALRADFNYSSWFSAIGEGASSTADLKPMNGSWSLTAEGEVSYASNSGLVFDLDDNESIAFTATDGTAPDTNTVTQVTVEGVFVPVLLSDLPTQAEMNSRNAQVGFVVAINGTATNFYAWCGGENWVKLSNANVVPDTENVTEVVATFNYTSSSASYASFAVVNNVLADDSSNTSFAITSTAATNRCIAGFSCYGSGTLVAASGSVGIGVASVDNVKYGSLADAATSAGTTAKTINVLRETSENVSLASDSNITISDPNGLATGTITVPSGTTVKVDTTVAQLNPATNGVYSIPLKTSGGTVVVNLPTGVAQYKEVATSNVTESAINVTLQTKSSIVLGTKPDGTKALGANETKLRNFLNTYANAAYAAADATSETLATALNANGANGLKLYQSYALGIAPTDSVKPVAMPKDESATGITLYIPALTNAVRSGDYNITYKVGETTVTPGAVTIPLPAAGTGSSTDVKILFE